MILEDQIGSLFTNHDCGSIRIARCQSRKHGSINDTQVSRSVYPKPIVNDCQVLLGAHAAGSDGMEHG